MDAFTTDSLTYGKLVETATRVEKKIGVLKDISAHKGLQLPLADPLVAALLLDTETRQHTSEGKLTPFCKPCLCTMNEVGKVSFKQDEKSTVYWLISDQNGHNNRKRLVKMVHEVLEAALER